MYVLMHISVFVLAGNASSLSPFLSRYCYYIRTSLCIGTYIRTYMYNTCIMQNKNNIITVPKYSCNVLLLGQIPQVPGDPYLL